MSTVQDKIYQYFERNPQLRVLFIFNNDWAAAELENAEWADGYRYVNFKSDWFTTKYNLDNDRAIAFDLDDGVVVNYAKFGDVLAEIK